MNNDQQGFKYAPKTPTRIASRRPNTTRLNPSLNQANNSSALLDRRTNGQHHQSGLHINIATTEHDNNNNNPASTKSTSTTLTTTAPNTASSRSSNSNNMQQHIPIHPESRLNLVIEHTYADAAQQNIPIINNNNVDSNSHQHQHHHHNNNFLDEHPQLAHNIYKNHDDNNNNNNTDLAEKNCVVEAILAWGVNQCCQLGIKSERVSDYSTRPLVVSSLYERFRSYCIRPASPQGTTPGSVRSIRTHLTDSRRSDFSSTLKTESQASTARSFIADYVLAVDGNSNSSSSSSSTGFSGQHGVMHYASSSSAAAAAHHHDDDDHHHPVVDLDHVNGEDKGQMDFISTIACGREHTVFVTDKGAVYGVGRASEGQLGPTSLMGSSVQDLVNEYSSGNRSKSRNKNQRQSQHESLHNNNNSSSSSSSNNSSDSSFHSAISSTMMLDDSEVREPTLLCLSHKIKSAACGEQHTLLLTDQGKVLSLGLEAKSSTTTNRTPGSATSSRSRSSSRDARPTDQYVAATMGVETDLDIIISSSHRIPRVIEQLKHEHVIMVACGSYHSLALTAHGTVYSWGKGSHGCLGHGDSDSISTPRRIDALVGTRIIHIAAGEYHSACVSDKGEVFCFGLNSSGQCGIHDNTIHDVLVPRKISFEFASPNRAKATKICMVACGKDFTLCLSKSGKVFGFGNTDKGQLCINTRELQTSNSASEVPTCVTAPIRLALFHRHSHGQQTPDTTTPREDGHKVIKIQCGEAYAVALTDCGKLYCWGSGYCLGFNDVLYSYTHVPRVIPFIEPEPDTNRKAYVVDVFCGQQHIFAIVQMTLPQLRRLLENQHLSSKQRRGSRSSNASSENVSQAPAATNQLPEQRTPATPQSGHHFAALQNEAAKLARTISICEREINQRQQYLNDLRSRTTEQDDIDSQQRDALTKEIAELRYISQVCTAQYNQLLKFIDARAKGDTPMARNEIHVHNQQQHHTRTLSQGSSRDGNDHRAHSSDGVIVSARSRDGSIVYQERNTSSSVAITPKGTTKTITTKIIPQQQDPLSPEQPKPIAKDITVKLTVVSPLKSRRSSSASAIHTERHHEGKGEPPSAVSDTAVQSRSKPQSATLQASRKAPSTYHQGSDGVPQEHQIYTHENHDIQQQLYEQPVPRQYHHQPYADLGDTYRPPPRRGLLEDDNLSITDLMHSHQKPVETQSDINSIENLGGNSEGDYRSHHSASSGSDYRRHATHQSPVSTEYEEQQRVSPPSKERSEDAQRARHHNQAAPHHQHHQQQQQQQQHLTPRTVLSSSVLTLFDNYYRGMLETHRVLVFSKLNDQRTKIERLMLAIAKLRNANTRLQADRTNKQKMVETLSHELELLSREYAALNELAQAEQQRNKELNSSNRALRQNIAERDEQITRLIEMYDALMAKQEHLQQQQQHQQGQQHRSNKERANSSKPSSPNAQHNKQRQPFEVSNNNNNSNSNGELSDESSDGGNNSSDEENEIALQKMKANNDYVSREIALYASKYSLLQKDYEHAVAQQIESNNKLNDALGKCERLKQRCERYEHENRSLQDQLRALRSQCQQNEAELNRRTRENMELAVELSALKKAAVFAQQQQHHSNNNSNNNTSSAHISSNLNNSELEMLKSKIEKLERSLLASSSSNSTSSSPQLQQQQQLMIQERLNATQEELFKVFSWTNEQLRNSVVSLQAQLDKYEARLEQLERENLSLLESQLAAKHTISQLQKESVPLQELKDECESLRGQLVVYRAKLREAVVRMQRWKRQVQQQQLPHQTLQQQHQLAMASMKQQLEQKHRDVIQLYHALRQSEQCTEELNNQLILYEEQVRTTIPALLDEIERLRRENSTRAKESPASAANNNNNNNAKSVLQEANDDNNDNNNAHHRRHNAMVNATTSSTGGNTTTTNDDTVIISGAKKQRQQGKQATSTSPSPSLLQGRGHHGPTDNNNNNNLSHDDDDVLRDFEFAMQQEILLLQQQQQQQHQTPPQQVRRPSPQQQQQQQCDLKGDDQLPLSAVELELCKQVLLNYQLRQQEVQQLSAGLNELLQELHQLRRDQHNKLGVLSSTIAMRGGSPTNNNNNNDCLSPSNNNSPLVVAAAATNSGSGNNNNNNGGGGSGGDEVYTITITFEDDDNKTSSNNGSNGGDNNSHSHTHSHDDDRSSIASATTTTNHDDEDTHRNHSHQHQHQHQPLQYNNNNNNTRYSSSNNNDNKINVSLSDNGSYQDEDHDDSSDDDHEFDEDDSVVFHFNNNNNAQSATRNGTISISPLVLPSTPSSISQSSSSAASPLLPPDFMNQ